MWPEELFVWYFSEKNHDNKNIFLCAEWIKWYTFSSCTIVDDFLCRYPLKYHFLMHINVIAPREDIQAYYKKEMSEIIKHFIDIYS